MNILSCTYANVSIEGILKHGFIKRIHTLVILLDITRAPSIILLRHSLVD